LRQDDNLKKVARELGGTAGDVENNRQDNTLLISEQDAARRLGISARHLWALRAKNAVPSARVGSRVLYPVAGLEAWVLAGCPTDENAADRLAWRGGAA
jgi:hypothetical protein